MSIQDRFPPDLIKDSIENKVKYFQDFTVAHPNLIKAAERLVTSLSEPAGSAVTFLFGPTGVGKTTLLSRTVQRLTSEFIKEYEENKGKILFAGFEAPTPDLRNFNWKDFYVRALEVLNDPLVDRDDHLLARMNVHHATKARLRLLLEKNLQYRQPKLFYVDEAQNLGRVSTARHLHEQADCIKSIANSAGIPILLVGTYELLHLRNLSGQLCRRSTEIHYPRYRAKSSSDVKVFKNIICTFQRHLPLEEEPDLIANWDFCYERSLGCVGILKDWLLRTFAGTLYNKSNAKTINLTDLEKYAYSLNACSTMEREIRQGEQVLEASISRDAFRIELGLDPIIDLKPEVRSSAPSAAKSPKPRRVGEPKPKRRKVGDDKNAS
ncbi:MAG: AAA family ATPase [Leptolyngbya sp.]|nr:MAG: AAA family ATPase [Leptolyngbya sp.]